MTDHGVLFKAEMIRACLAGRKTQTRRPAWSKKTYLAITGGRPLHKPTRWRSVKPGDRLWARETWLPRGNGTAALYRADHDTVAAAGIAGLYSDHGWKPAIHMPRWASRITWVVTAVRIERLQGLSEADCIAEGLVSFKSGDTPMYGVRVDGGYEHCGLTARESYMNLWCKLHGPDAWVNNPEVVVITGAVHLCNIDQLKEAA